MSYPTGKAVFCVKRLTPADLQSHLKVRRHPSMPKQMLFFCDPFGFTLVSSALNSILNGMFSTLYV